MLRIKRPNYLDWLVRHKDKQIIKVVSGVRRCGKSTLFAIYRDYLLENGVDDRQIILLNFEDVEYEELSDYRLLYDYVKQLLLPDRMNYIFLDEIQHVDKFEKAVDNLFLRENCDVYITGSNVYFMSGDLSTRLSGRYVELKMLPLSFKEFYSGLDEQKQKLTKSEKFNLYVELSSFPYVLRYGYGQKEAREYLRDLYNTVLLKDVVARLRIRCKYAGKRCKVPSPQYRQPCFGHENLQYIEIPREKHRPENGGSIYPRLDRQLAAA